MRVSRKLASIGKKIINEIVLLGFVALGRLVSLKGIPILAYHSVNGENQGSVTRSNFFKQMQYLHDKGIKVISLEDMVHGLNKKKVPEKCVVLTFDDGYRAVYDIAFPILKDFKFTATIFLPTGRIEKTLDWDKSDGLFGASLMSWQEIKEMSCWGVEFDAHSVTHPHLPQIGLEECRKEIAPSKAKIEAATGKPVRFFSFPYGGYNEDTKNIVKEFGFTGACTTRPGLNKPGQDLFELKRMGVFRDTSLLGFKTRLDGTFKWYFNTKRRIYKNKYRQ